MSSNGFQQLSVLYFADAMDAECRDHQLARAGYLVDRAFTFIRAASLAESHPYSCLLFGQAVPAEQRTHIAHLVRAANPHALVVMLSSALLTAAECAHAVGGASPGENADGLPDAILPADVDDQQLASMLLQLLMSKASRRAREARAS